MFSPSAPIEAIRWSGRLRKPPAPARRACIVLAALALIATALLLVLPRHANAQAVMRGEASFNTTAGYGRLVLRFPQPVDARVSMTGNILVISFRQPVSVAVDRLYAGNTDWMGAARRDPDGRALRFAIARKVKLNTITAAERLYVDLLPESWTGNLPGLPQEVVEELARRATEAERAARALQEQAEQKKVAAVRVRIASHSTFTRYMFELPELTGVTTQRARDNLTLSFARKLEFDLAEAKLALPQVVESVDATPADDTTAVRFSFHGEVDIRTFREDFSYVVDVTPVDKSGQRADTRAKPTIEPPETAPPKQTEAKPGPAVVPVASAPAVMPNPGDDNGAPPDKPTKAPAKPQEAAAEAAPKPVRAAAPADVAASESAPRDPTRPVAVELRRQGDNLRMIFPFAAPTPAAVFLRADTLWMVFDTPTTRLDVAVLETDPSRTIRSVSVSRQGEARVVRLKLERPRLASLAADGTGWVVTLGDGMADPSKPLGIARNIVGPGRSSVTVPFDDPRHLHWLSDPEIGDTLMVVTGLGPARGFLKTQNFVDFRALASAHGVVVQRFADDLNAELSADKVLVGRPGGLTLSEANAAARRPGVARAVTFDTQSWGFDRTAKFLERQNELITAAAEAPQAKRTAQRLELARFYLSREMYAEAKAVLDVAIADERPSADDPSPLVLRAVTNLMLERPDAAMKDLANPIVGNQHDAQLWRAIAYARQGKWAEARENFRHVEAALGTLPLELQRFALKDSLRASIESGDFATGAIKLNDFETVGVPPELEPAVAVLTGRLAEGLGRKDDALASYQYAVASRDRPSAAAGRLREIALRYTQGETKKPEVINDLEVLTTAWRGDDTEIEALQILGRLYVEESRYRDAFAVMRIAMAVHPNSDITRRIHDGAAQAFDTLFLGGKGDALPAIDALSLFYDYRDLTPIGRRGDEMIRRLSDRLVSVDLLDQAAELLQHQVDHRLQGAARAQVATRLAVIYLLNRKPDRAQATLRATRSADLSNDVRNQRLLIEARALSDIGRHDLAIEIIANIIGPEATRLRSDIYWAGRRWQLSAEHMELVYGDRWKDFQPLSDGERSDILRAGIAYALAEDSIGISRLREKYAAKMGEGTDKRAFALVTGGIGTNSAEFRSVARTIAQVDTLDGFLRDMRARYPEMNAYHHAPAHQQPAAAPAKPDKETTGSIDLR